MPPNGLKNSVHPVQRAAVVEVRSCCENEGIDIMVCPMKPKAYCQGVVSVAPVPQRWITPVEGSIVVIVAEGGLVRSDRGTARSGGTPADSALRQHSQSAGIDFDKNGGSAVIGGDHEGCAVSDIDNRRAHDTVAGAVASNRKRPDCSLSRY